MRELRLLVGLTIMLTFLGMHVYGSADPVEELENRLKQASSPPGQLEVLSALVDRCKQEYPQKALDYGNRALQILHDFPGGAGDAIKVNILNGMCWASGLLGQYHEALALGKEAETLAYKLGDKQKLAVTFGSMANIYLYLSDFQTALNYALKAKAMSEAVDYKKGTVSALVSIARVHRNLQEYEKALDNYKQALDISDGLGNQGDVAQILSNMATVYWNLKQYPKALDFYSRGLKIMKDLGSEMGIAQILYNLACVYSDTGKYDRALQYDLEALTLFEKLGNQGQIAFTLGSIGRDHGNLHRNAQALDYLDRGLQIALKLDMKDSIRWLYREYTHIYESSGDYQNAFLYHKKFKEASDEILNEDINRRIAHLQVIYEVEKKEKENQLLKKNNHIQELELKQQKLDLDRQKLLRNFLALVSVLVVIIALVIFNRSRIRKKAEQILRVSEQKLKKMNTAKDKLFTIIAHDLGSPLNSLLLSAGHLKDHFTSLDENDLDEFIQNIYKQTRDMADLLENLLQWAITQIGKIQHNPETVDIRLLTEEALEPIQYTAHNKKIRLSVHIGENTLAWADKHMMKAVMRNLLSNAIKYTYPGGEIKVSAADSGNYLEITVSDNGIGIAEERIGQLFKEEITESTRGTSHEKGTGLGLVLCKEFVEKNGGRIRVQSQPRQGSHFSFTLPKRL
ncbi:MAG: tetratricopeptide repeat-containing sensor histidine kinase [Candidatus Aminicenantes bacterium]|nr:tetratricopeptide repeat-containing sensor histidine kinase [Candidatus Aminicenantes bacterium]